MNFFKTSKHNLERAKSLSKKIQKFNKFIRKPLIKRSGSFFLNFSYAEDSISTCDVQSNFEIFSMIEEEKPEEDLPISPKSNHSTVSYISSKNQKTYSFSCFSEKDIALPEECRKKIVELSCDDDCMTDDDQIQGAIKKLYNSLQESANKRNKNENKDNKF